MKFVLHLIVPCAIALPTGATPLEMPEWEGDTASASLVGSGLWPDDEREAPPGGESAASEPAPATEERVNAGEGLPGLIFIRRKTPFDAEPFPREEPEELPPIRGELREQFFGDRPRHYLVDPQRILTEQKANDIHRFLEFHSEESLYPVFLLVTGENQVLPGDVDLDAVLRRWFADGPGVILVYRAEAPENLHLRISSPTGAPPAESVLSRMEEACVREALAADNPSDQVERLVVELSIQLAWFERQGRDVSSTSELTAREEETSLPATPPVASSATPGAASGREMMGDAGSFLREVPALWAGGGGGVLVLAALVMHGLARSRARARKPILFPVYRSRPRLGGRFTGGAFVGISFEMGKADGRIE